MSDELWNKIGFHRPLAGFWHNLVYQIWAILAPAVLFLSIFKYLYPYPEMRGYSNTFSGIFVLIFTIFDLGTTATVERYIADENIKNPAKMVQYIQYFIWYQAFTGLIQITIISIWALKYITSPNLLYGVWIMLAYIIKQYPGFPGVFKAVLSSLQQFNKSNIIEFVQNQGLQVITETGCVLLGIWYGSNNPKFGIIMGVAIGMTLGLYLDDFIATFIAAYYVAKQLRPFGISFKRLFYIEFDFDLVKECISFGVKMGIPGLLGSAVSVFGLMLCLEYIPQYITLAALASLASQFNSAAEKLAKQDFTPIFTEAYQNGKIKLCQYYNAHCLRFFSINSGFAITIMLIISSMFPYFIVGFDLPEYAMITPFLIPTLISRAFRPYKGYPGNILVGAHRPNQIFLINSSMNLLQITLLYLWIVVLKIQMLGSLWIVFIISLSDFPVDFLNFIISMTYIHKRVFKLKIMTWQTIAVPLFSIASLYVVFLVIRILFLDTILQWNIIIGIIVGFLIIAILLFLFYFPLSVLLGGWDENSLRDLKNAVKMSGLSKMIVQPMTFLVFKVAKISKLHNRFKFDEKEALQEIQELIKIRDSHLVIEKRE